MTWRFPPIVDSVSGLMEVYTSPGRGRRGREQCGAPLPCVLLWHCAASPQAICD